MPTVSVSNCFLLCWLLDVEVPAARICAVWVDNNTRHVCTPSIPAGRAGLTSETGARNGDLLEGDVRVNNSITVSSTWELTPVGTRYS